METEKKLLNVGDEIAEHNYGTYTGVLKIDRVTEKFAFAGKSKFKREYFNPNWISVYGGDKWSRISYSICTPEIKHAIRMNNKRKKVANFNFSILSDDQINRIYDILIEAK